MKKKKFSQLNVGDKVYLVKEPNTMTFHTEIEVQTVVKKRHKTEYSELYVLEVVSQNDELISYRLDEKDEYYSSFFLLFSNEVDAYQFYRECVNKLLESIVNFEKLLQKKTITYTEEKEKLNIIPGDKCRIAKTMTVTVDGDNIECYDDNIGDEVVLNGYTVKYGVELKEVFDATNLTKGYGMYVHREVLEKIDDGESSMSKEEIDFCLKQDYFI